MPHSSTRPARVTYWNSLLSVSTRHIRGYEAFCACGWVSDVHRERPDAQLDARLHNDWHRQQTAGRA